jgi:peroxiredoxin Q/BCP
MTRSLDARVLAACAFCLLLVLGACGAQKRPDGGEGLLAVGAEAPELSGKDAAGQPVTLQQVRGRPAVVYFYPKDGTPGCTKEACAFRDAWETFTKQGVMVFGVSRDSEQSHAEFRKDHELPFPLVSDESGAITAAYGVSSRLGMPERVTFLVDKAGRIAKVWPDVDPGVHAKEVLAEAAKL